MIEQWVEEALRQAVENPGALQIEKRGRGHAQNLLQRLAQRGGPVGKVHDLSRQSTTGTRVRYFVHGESDWGGPDEHQRNETYAAMILRHQAESASYLAGSDLVCWLRMEEASGPIADSSGNGNSGTVSGCIYRQAGIESYSLEWDGVDDLITVTDASELQNIWDGSGGSFAAWIYADTIGEASEGFIARKGSGSVGWVFQLANPSGNTAAVRFEHYFTGADGRWITTTNPISFGSWFHVAVVYLSAATTNDPSIYINGAAVALTENSTPTGTRDPDATYDFLIGNNSTGIRTWDGRIDEVEVWDRVLTAEEIRAHYYLGRLKLGLIP